MSAPPVVLTPAQETLVHLPMEGQFLVRGAAGSGKSLVALERAVHLARQPLLHGAPKVLLLAATPALAAELAAGLAQRAATLGPRIDVAAPADFCRKVLGADAPGDLDDAAFVELVAEALHLCRRATRRQILRRPLPFFTSELASMLLALGVERFDQYVEVDREGRGSPLDEESRRTVFALFETWRGLARALGRTHRHALVPAALARLATARIHPYDHVVVDDAHRLVPVELRLVRTLAAAGSLTLFAALEQRFDPLAATLRELGLERLDRTEVLPLVQRGPAKIHDAALAVLKRKRPGDSDLAAILPGAIDGARPRLLLADGFDGELAAAVGELRRAKSEGRRWRDLAVLGARRLPLELLAAILGRAGVATRFLGSAAERTPADADADAVKLCPVAEAAGREFPFVLLLDANRGSFPRPPHELADHERAGAEEAGRRDLHLAMSRATEELIVVATERTRSPLLPLKKMNLERVVADGGEPAAAATSRAS